MPKAAPYLLAWSPAQQSYTLTERAHHEMLDIAPASPAWFAWLDEAPSFTFRGKAGSYTARKEANRPGEGYWYAYVRSGEKLLKKYVGRTTEVTLARLEDVAHALSSERDTHLQAGNSTVTGQDLQAPSLQLGPLLATKLHPPRLRTQLVPRFHLVERLQHGMAGALTLVSAPAGFGKTTLLSQWLSSTRTPVAWLSLEPEDNEPTRFLTYLTAALQTLDPQFGASVLALLAPPQPADLQMVLTVLANDLIGLQGVAGLQLAGLSLQGRADASSLLGAFTGSHRFVLDYLSEEVLSRQPASVQTFLIQTSVLSRLCGSLCDAVTGLGESQEMLEALERANLFVVALDDERQWYRYHQLFADLLRSRLHQTMPDLQPVLHRRASAWYEQHDLIGDALHHARLAPDLDRAMRLVEQHTHELVFIGQAHTVLSWLASLPDGLVRTHPRLCLSQALLLLFTGQLGEALLRLQDAEQSASSVMQAEEAQPLLNQVATVQAYILFFQGDLARSVALAQQAADQLVERPVQVREATDLIAAHRRLLSGDVRRVEEQRVTQLPSQHSVGRDVFAMEVFVHLTGTLLHARLLRLQGRLRQAAATYEQMVQLQGVYEGELLIVEEFANLAETRQFAPALLAFVGAVRAQLELMEGNLAAAVYWVEAKGLSGEDDLAFPREREYLTFARVRIAQGRADLAGSFLSEALGLLERLQADAERSARTGSVLEILILKALALSAQGRSSVALPVLERALRLSEPQGYIRLFVDEGAPMVSLLRQADVRRIAPHYVATLPSAAGESKLPASSPAGSLLEPLTERERQVLQLLMAGLSNQAIAQELIVTVGTVKRHLNSIYGKLGVQSRTQAVAHAQALHLL